MFLLISTATAVLNTLASVRGYVVSFFSYKVCAIDNVSSGLILNLLAHIFCNSARLKSSGAAFLLFFTSTFSILATLPLRKEIKLSASAFFKKPQSLNKF